MNTLIDSLQSNIVYLVFHFISPIKTSLENRKAKELTEKIPFQEFDVKFEALLKQHYKQPSVQDLHRLYVERRPPPRFFENLGQLFDIPLARVMKLVSTWQHKRSPRWDSAVLDRISEECTKAFEELHKKYGRKQQLHQAVHERVYEVLDLSADQFKLHDHAFIRKLVHGRVLELMKQNEESDGFCVARPESDKFRRKGDRKC